MTNAYVAPANSSVEVLDENQGQNGEKTTLDHDATDAQGASVGIEDDPLAHSPTHSGASTPAPASHMDSSTTPGNFADQV